MIHTADDSGRSYPVYDMPLWELRRVVDTLLTQTSRLHGQVVSLHGEVASLQNNASRLTAVVALKDADIVAVKDEIARLKGLPPLPKFRDKPSGMEEGTSPPVGKKGRDDPRFIEAEALAIHLEDVDVGLLLRTVHETS